MSERHDTFGQWAADFRWAMNMMHVRRFRRTLGFEARIRFDNALRPKPSRLRPQPDPVVIDYPDAPYHITVDDVLRAMHASARP